MKRKIFSKGDVVTALSGKHSGETGTVEHSDKSILRKMHCIWHSSFVIKACWAKSTVFVILGKDLQ
jgi:ribosomal protein S4E